MAFEEQKAFDFNAIRLKLASPDEIHSWSYGEVTKPETINYRTQKPEKSGLFAEEIFGPSKDWECYCGKYKKIRYKGIICDKCGVEVTRSIVRRERMGHIDLAAPVSHIWFLRGVPSKIGLVLDLSVQYLEKVIYFANFIITSVDETLRTETLKQIDQEEKAKRKSIEVEFQRLIDELKSKRDKDLNSAKTDSQKNEARKRFEEELQTNTSMRDEKMKELSNAADIAKRELRGLEPLQILSEQSYHDLSLRYGHVFEAGIGAEAIRQLLAEINFDKTIPSLEHEQIESPENKKRRIVRRLKLIRSLKVNKIRPEWMILTTIPVIPPDLRPMIQLDGGRFAASDLNDLYRRVINRNNRLKRLLELNAPEVICRNEKRMLQEAVDALIDNSARHGKTVTASTGQKRMLKSLADILKGKQGRFRQNLLGKRVDYSGRSVIVVGPNLRMDQCGLPKRMALELFKPFIISKLIKRELVHNVRSANRFIESERPEVWDILEEVTKDSLVLLNRAPTLHRLGIQAFQPVLIEGKAIQIHPFVCAAFNADFDGDQMAVHVPLTEKAKWEARELELSTKNLLKPATGTPIATPSQDVVLGCFYMTHLIEKKPQEMKYFANKNEALMAYQLHHIGIRDAIRVRIDGKTVISSVGRILFNEILPKEFQYVNDVMDKKTLTPLIGRILNKLGNEKTVEILDNIKTMAFHNLTKSGISWGMNDLRTPPDKYKVLEEAEKVTDEIRMHYESGLLTDEERRMKVIETWARAKDAIQKISKAALDRNGPIFAMIESGARGSWGQITQMMGMKGLVTNPAGETIELPVKASFLEGFDVLEYFISTHGARKGLSDTALRTANAGYLTRRLIDVAQDVVITEEDCKDTEGVVLTSVESEDLGIKIVDRILGRTVLEPIIDPKTKKVIAKKNELITEEVHQKLKELQIDKVHIRSVMTCRTIYGLCQRCYGYDLGYNKVVSIGIAVGIIAAQSIGEPGTQLTMRTFHTGGVAGQDITQGLPRVEELFEARPVKRPALMAEVAGQVSVQELEKGAKLIRIHTREQQEEKYRLESKQNPVLKVKDKSEVKEGDVLFTVGAKEVRSKVSGMVKKTDQGISIVHEQDKTHEYPVPSGVILWVKDGDMVASGVQLTEGHIDLHQLYRLKGREAVQKYIIKEIQYIYFSQGQHLNDKHVEVIVRQMFSRYFIKDTGDTDLLEGEIVERTRFMEENEAAKQAGKREAISEQLLLGITKSSLSIDSFLSAASFQETARVLIDAAISGKVDRLRGLKENVIIGRLIPAGTGYQLEEAEEVSK